ncbi:DUF305 domain-containing protein [Solwaraspora sp. WMMD791]|uniref:DUF305 domain-containing protein n=1 Tax=Solwaraspora sp. WMMD791 TaxID=3016086 RepID=UPI00249AA2B7|nr:DUF305 domain-containing protein [Solwaraspora sp. WMMD791]WFE26226.1 DUF305 domain-containing protein [Solwaraspora sp. WMMD791]
MTEHTRWSRWPAVTTGARIVGTSARRAVAVAVGGLAAAVLVGGCTAGPSANGADPTAEPSAATAPAAPNATDIAFARDMIPHHQQAIEMAQLVAGRSASTDVQDLAGRIRAAQDPEIDQMASWLTEWGQPLPSPGQHTGADDHHGMPGMLTGDEMTALANSTGAEFDRLFLDMMIRHHEGAVQMARILRADGADPAVRQLAESIATSQEAEIGEMRELLAGI